MCHANNPANPRFWILVHALIRIKEQRMNNLATFFRYYSIDGMQELLYIKPHCTNICDNVLRVFAQINQSDMTGSFLTKNKFLTSGSGPV